MVGSKINAYLNANFYLRWALSPRLSLTSGVTLTHFSNGNTNFPNAGVNTLGGKLGVEYNFYRKEDLTSLHAAASYHIPPFQRHVSYDWFMAAERNLDAGGAISVTRVLSGFWI